MKSAIILLLIGAGAALAQNGPQILSSPDGRLLVTFETVTNATAGGRGRGSISPEYGAAPEGGQLVYSVSFQGKPVIEPSRMGLELGDLPALGRNVHMTHASASENDDTYQLIAGKTCSARNYYKAIRIELEEGGASGRKLALEARAYNDALAFRYVVPEQPALSEFRLRAERTEFRLAKDATSYSLLLPNYRSMYESEFVRLPLSAFSNQGGVKSELLCGCPMLLEVPGVAWVAITDADLRDYSSMYLVNPSGSWLGHWLESRLAPQVENTNLCVTGALPHHSSWRVLMIASDPCRLIESTVLTSLNPPCAIQDTSWIKAGKASWDWWSGTLGPDGKSAYTTETMKYYVDFAARSGFEYMLIDAGWFARSRTSEGNADVTRMNGSVDVPEVVRYAAAKGVKIWIWSGYEALNRQMDEAFPLYEKWGVAGVKTDFIERDDQEGVNFYYRSAELAARHHLMMDYHGGSKPSGLERTWPNIMGYEAVAGMEQSKAGARDNPDHHVTLPFTRMLTGPMDYTPGAFENVTREQFQPRFQHPMVMGTRAHQLAMYVVYQAASQMVSDWPGNYEGQPAFQFIKDVPATWDETRALNGLPGQFVTIARRRGNQWFLGSMTGWTPRELVVPLDFLGKGSYTAEIYADGKDADVLPKNVAIQKKTVQASTKLQLRLAPGGGCAVRFVPAR